ncbi:MAG: hypothetical protein WDO71_13990 [Bacteroidota bacterium]
MSFFEAGELPIPDGSDPGPGQFSKDGLSYYFSFENPNKEVSSGVIAGYLLQVNLLTWKNCP